MSLKKTVQTGLPPSPLPDSSPSSPSPSPFDLLENRQPPVFQQPLRLSASNSALNPLYCPPHIYTAWGIDGTGEGSVNQLRYEKGYEMATTAMVTANLAEAKEKGLICLQHFNADTTNQYVKYRELFLLVTKREWWENRQKLASLETSRQIEDVASLVPGAKASRESMVGAFDEEADGFFQNKE